MSGRQAGREEGAIPPETGWFQLMSATQGSARDGGRQRGFSGDAAKPRDLPHNTPQAGSAGSSPGAAAPAQPSPAAAAHLPCSPGGRRGRPGTPARPCPEARSPSRSAPSWCGRRWGRAGARGPRRGRGARSRAQPRRPLPAAATCGSNFGIFLPCLPKAPREQGVDPAQQPLPGSLQSRWLPCGLCAGAPRFAQV